MTGKPLLDKILITISLIATLGVLGLFIYTVLIYKKPLPDDKKEFAKLQTESKQINVAKGFTLKKIIINLKSTRKLRFLSTKMVLVPFKEKQVEKIKVNEAMLRDVIIDIGSQMSASQLNSITGKIIFEEKVKDEINKKFKKPLIKEIFFSNFVVQ
jgi:flagellar FliL protein